ncbi:Rubredoxin [Pseudomonas syringae pv. actinidiae]|uniref:Rubredoxin n=1 Tax=Pseudomonas syringae pv. actinidiae TaxID=103796 RepID=A0A7Z6UCY5_PSESF|nr:Rubredoxin [Pseudomonas syringae pv. actinidiae]
MAGPDRPPVAREVIESDLHPGVPISTTPVQTAIDRRTLFSLINERTEHEEVAVHRLWPDL